MSRIDAKGDFANNVTTWTVTGLTLSGVNRLVMVGVVNYNDSAGNGRVVDTITIGGTTVYDLGVSEGARVAQLVSDAQVEYKLEVFRVFNSALPANGSRDVVVTLTGLSDAGLCIISYSYDGADQSTGFRGTAASYTTEDATLSLSFTADGADLEGLAFVSWDGGETLTPTAPSTTTVGAIGTIAIIQDMTRAAGGSPIAGVLSGPKTREVGWGASIMAAGGGGGGQALDSDYLLHLTVQR